MVQRENDTALTEPEDVKREIEELNKQIEMEMAVYSGMEYIAGKTEKD